MRSKRTIEAAAGEVDDRVWLNRHVELVAEQATSIGENEARQGVEAAYRLLGKYGEDAIVDNDYDTGFLLGKLSALRWVLGLDWDELDT